MTERGSLRRSEAGEVRPSQIVTTFGIGSLIDLPNLSVIVLGLDDWRKEHTTPLVEKRLLRLVQQALGPQVVELRSPPQPPEDAPPSTQWFDENRLIGLPVAPFPRWLVCSRCRLLAEIRSGLFTAETKPFRPERTRYTHDCASGKLAATALPARFLVACENGHLDDFPWRHFVHRGASDCPAELRFFETGPTGEAADVRVKCMRCETSRSMAEAFGRRNQDNLPPCTGRRPHLRDHDSAGCSQPHVRAMLQGATGAWFSLSLAVLALPPNEPDGLTDKIERNAALLDQATSSEVLRAFRAIGHLRDFAGVSDDALWRALEQRRQSGAGMEPAAPADVRREEWQRFSNPAAAQTSTDFKLREVAVPQRYAQHFERVVLAERLREVRALIGFTRLESPRDFESPLEIAAAHRAPLARRPPTWVPASECRGEGIFIQFREASLVEWRERAARAEPALLAAWQRFRAARNLDPNTGFPGLRYALLHTFAHALIRQFSVECGYTTAALAERIYSSDPEAGVIGAPQGGVLIYTSAPDSEGTLGGLSALGEPERLQRHLARGLEKAGLCASDPLCAEHRPAMDASLHGAACHACAFLPETSCERSNRFLDRALLVPTMADEGLAFFQEP